MTQSFLKLLGSVAAALMMLTNGAGAGDTAAGWTLDAGGSKVAFGSIKKNSLGEVHSFPGLTGTVTPEGKVTVEIDVASIETNIDIRNKRMLRYVLNGAPKAILSAQIDMAELTALEVGSTTEMDVTGKLNFNGKDIDIDTTMFVARLGKDKVIVNTDDMIMVSTADLGIDAGIDELMKLAKLPGITRVTPVTLRLVFTSDAAKS